MKGAYAGLRSLCCEWVAGWLAKVVLDDLPIGVPMIAMAEVPRALIEGSARKDIKDLGAGPVFASMRIEDGQEPNCRRNGCMWMETRVCRCNWT